MHLKFILEMFFIEDFIYFIRKERYYFIMHLNNSISSVLCNTYMEIYILDVQYLICYKNFSNKENSNVYKLAGKICRSGEYNWRPPPPPKKKQKLI